VRRGAEVNRNLKIATNVIAVLTLGGIGGLQMFGVNAGLVTSYGADLLAPPLLYLWLRQGRTIVARFLRRGPPTPAVSFMAVMIPCFLWEWSQRYDFGGTPLAIARGTFDPLDLLAYILGLAAVYAVDVLWLRPRRLMPA
jgi:hypothetical protein